MPEHTPAPTPGRAVYGFVMYLTMKTFFITYILWAIIPDDILISLNLTYTPQKYWAIAVPVQILVATFIFGFFIYPGLNFCLSPAFDSVYSVTDNNAVYRCSYAKNDCKCKNKIVKNNSWVSGKLMCSEHNEKGGGEPALMKSRINIEKFCDCLDKNNCGSKTSINTKPVEPVLDIPLSEVNKILYT